MAFNRTYTWVVQGQRRKEVLASFDQPLTAAQIARRHQIALDPCLHVLWMLRRHDITTCLNPETRHNRLHWLTPRGKECQQRLRRSLSLPSVAHRFPETSWDLYSSVCYKHRTAVIRAMREPMQQAAAIKRRALFQNPNIRMSANNVRDVLRYLLKHQIVEKARVKRKRHPRYDLTDLGQVFRDLVEGAEAFLPSL